MDNEAATHATNEQYGPFLHAAKAENFTQGGGGGQGEGGLVNDDKIKDNGDTKSAIAKKRTIVAWVPAQMTKHNRTSRDKKARKDNIVRKPEGKEEEDNVMKGFFSKYLHHKRSKKLKKKVIKRSKIHKRNKQNKKQVRRNKIRNSKTKKHSKKMNLEVKNAVAQLESLIQEKNKMKIGLGSDNHAKIERRDKIRTVNEYGNTVFSGPVAEPKTPWFKRDLKETGADYFPTANQFASHQPTKGYTRSQITGTVRSALRDPDDLEKELLAKVEKAKRLLKENFIKKRNQTSGISEEDSAKMDSLLLNKYEKQNSVLTSKLSNMLNDTKSIDNILGKLENEDDEENFLLKKENEVIAKHLVKSADDIYASDKKKLIGMDAVPEEVENARDETRQPDVDRAKKELYDMVALTNDTNASINNNNNNHEANVTNDTNSNINHNEEGDNVEEFTKSTSSNSTYDRDNIEPSNTNGKPTTSPSSAPEEEYSPYERQGEAAIVSSNATARNETNESIYPSVFSDSQANPTPAEERNLTYALEEEPSNGRASKNATMLPSSNDNKDNVVDSVQDENENYPKESVHPKSGFVSIIDNINNVNNNNNNNNTSALSKEERKEEKSSSVEQTTNDQVKVAMTDENKKKVGYNGETSNGDELSNKVQPNKDSNKLDNDKNKPKGGDNENKEKDKVVKAEDGDDNEKKKTEEVKGREPSVQMAGPNSHGFEYANNNTFQNAFTNKTKTSKNDKGDDAKPAEKQNDEEGEKITNQNDSEAEDSQDSELQEDHPGASKPGDKPTKDEKKKVEKSLNDSKPKKETPSDTSKLIEEKDPKDLELQEDHPGASKPGDKPTKDEKKKVEKSLNDSKPKKETPSDTSKLIEEKDPKDLELQEDHPGASKPGDKPTKDEKKKVEESSNDSKPKKETPSDTSKLIEEKDSQDSELQEDHPGASKPGDKPIKDEKKKVEESSNDSKPKKETPSDTSKLIEGKDPKDLELQEDHPGASKPGDKPIKDEKKKVEESSNDSKPKKETPSDTSKLIEEKDPKDLELQEDHPGASKPGDKPTKDEKKKVEESSNDSKPKEEENPSDKKDDNKTPMKDTSGDFSFNYKHETKNATQQQVENEMLDYEKKTKNDKLSREKIDEPNQQQHDQQQQQQESEKIKAIEIKEENDDLNDNNHEAAKEMLDYEKIVKAKNKTLELPSLDQMREQQNQNQNQNQNLKQEVDSEQQTNTKHKAMEIDNEKNGKSKEMAKEMLAYDEIVKIKNKTSSDPSPQQPPLPSEQSAESSQKEVGELITTKVKEKPVSTENLKNEKPEDKKVTPEEDSKKIKPPKKEASEASKLPKEKPEERLPPKLLKEIPEKIKPPKKEASEGSKLPKEKPKEKLPPKLLKEKSEEIITPKKEANDLEKDEEKGKSTQKTFEEQQKLEADKDKESPKIDDVLSTKNINNNIQTPLAMMNHQSNNTKDEIGEAIDSVISKAAGSNIHLQNTPLTNGYSKKILADDEFVTKQGKSPPLVAFREDKGNETLKSIVKELKESMGVIDSVQQQSLNDSATTVHKEADVKHEVCYI